VGEGERLGTARDGRSAGAAAFSGIVFVFAVIIVTTAATSITITITTIIITIIFIIIVIIIASTTISNLAESFLNHLRLASKLQNICKKGMAAAAAAAAATTTACLCIQQHPLASAHNVTKIQSTTQLSHS
jgi:amino acid transporter